jgi:IS5 family transposase
MIYFKKRTQKPLLDFYPGLTKRHLNYLKKTIYYSFRMNILPYISVKHFAKHFSSTTGRHTKDIQSMLGLFIIQAILNLTDSEAVEAYCFNDAVRFALDLPRDDYLCERTYYYYRSKLLGEAQELFDSTLAAIVEHLNIDLAIQRTDSTIVTAALKNMSKLELFRTTVHKFLKELQQTHKRIYSRIDEDIRNRYFPEDENTNWFASCKPIEYSDCLIQIAKDILNLIEMFKDHKKVNQLESFSLLKRLAEEQITIEEDGIKIGITLEKKGDALVNPHDPDVQYNGYYEKAGYKMNITETCSKSKDEPNPNLITHVEVAKANTPDKELLNTSVEKLENKNLKPKTMLADNGYDSEDNRQELETRKIELVCPPAGEPPDGFGIMDFKISDDGRKLLECPMGQRCLKNKVKTKDERTNSYFERKICKGCQHLDDCPVKLTKRKAVVAWQWKKPNIEARRRMFEEDKDIISLYRQRSGVESTFSLAKRKFGLDRTTRRGFIKNRLQIILVAIGINVLRMHNWMLQMEASGQFSKNTDKNELNKEELYILFLRWVYFLNICVIFCCFYKKRKPALSLA